MKVLKYQNINDLTKNGNVENIADKLNYRIDLNSFMEYRKRLSNIVDVAFASSDFSENEATNKIFVSCQNRLRKLPDKDNISFINSLNDYFRDIRNNNPDEELSNFLQNSVYHFFRYDGNDQYDQVKIIEFEEIVNTNPYCDIFSNQKILCNESTSLEVKVKELTDYAENLALTLIKFCSYYKRYFNKGDDYTRITRELQKVIARTTTLAEQILSFCAINIAGHEDLLVEV